MSRIADCTFSKKEQITLKVAIKIIVSFVQKDLGLLQADIARHLGFSLSHFKRIKSSVSSANLTQQNINQLCRIGISQTCLFDIGESQRLRSSHKRVVRTFFREVTPLPSINKIVACSIERDCKAAIIEDIESFGSQRLLDASLYKNSIVFWAVLERDLMQCVTTLTAKYLCVMFSSKTPHYALKNNTFLYDGVLFSLLSQSCDKTNSVSFYVEKVNFKPENNKATFNRYDLNEYAKYSEFSVFVKGLPSACYLAIEELLNIAVDKVYAFLDQACLEYNVGQPLNVIGELYALCRASAPINQPFWLYLIHKKGAIYLFDRLSKKNALQDISSSGQAMALSRSDCLIRMMGQKSAPEDVIDASVVIPNNRKISYHALDEASKISMLSYPQHLMMGEGRMIVQPLVGTEVGNIYKDDVSWLTVVYEEKNNIFGDHFEKLRPHLSMILLSQQSSITCHIESDNGRAYY